MKLKDLMKAIIETLSKSEIAFKQIEPYEGQFEDADNFIIMPPAVFVDFPSGGKSQNRKSSAGADIQLYLCTNNLHAKSQTRTMLEAIDIVSKELPGSKVTRPFLIKYIGWEQVGNFPGLKVYQINFRAD